MDENESDNEVFLEVNNSSEEVIGAQVKRKTLVAPWKDVEEFHQVYEWIYGPDASDETKKRACRQMTIWKIRRANLAPAAVLGTLVILETQLKDSELTLTPTNEQMKDLQIHYSSSFTRFFNYMSSIMQNKNMKSMYDTAKELQLRSFVVDLRHICAHGQVMPSIDVLRSTSKYCLRWLQTFYWKFQADSMLNVDTKNIRRTDQTQFEENVMQLFQFYDSVLEHVLNGQTRLSKQYLKKRNFEELTEYAAQKSISNNVCLLLDEIIKDLAVLAKLERSMVDLGDIYIAAVMEMRFFFDLVEKHTGTEEQLEFLIHHIQGLFRLLAVYGIIEDLFNNLLAIVENANEEDVKRRAAAFWAYQLVVGFIAFRRCKDVYKYERELDPTKTYDLTSLNFQNTSKKVLQFYSRIGINVKKLLIFGDTVRRPWVWTFDRNFVEQRLRYVNQFSVEILKNILYLVDPPLSDSQIKMLKGLFDQKIRNDMSEIPFDQQVVDDSIDGENYDEPMGDELEANRVYTVEDLPLEAALAKEGFKCRSAFGSEFLGTSSDPDWDSAPNTARTGDSMYSSAVSSPRDKSSPPRRVHFASSMGEEIPPHENSSDGIKKYGIWSTVPECQDWYACPIGKLIWD